MSRDDPLSQFAKQIRFAVEIASDTVRAVGVPCLLKDATESTCTIEKSRDPTNGMPSAQVGGAVHGVRITTAQPQDGRVYNANGTPIGNYIAGDGETWSDISIRKGSQGRPEDDRSANDVVYRYAKHIVGALWAARESGSCPGAALNPFKIPNTFEDRAAIRPIQDRIRGQQVAIIGLGGSGSFVLDLLAKTPVGSIHLLDSDTVDWHTLFRAPGAPSTEEIEAVRNGTLLKVEYYRSRYTPLRDGIYAHPVQVDSTPKWREFLLAHPVEYAFVCIDQIIDADSPRRDAVYQALSDTRIPFVDSGVSISIESGAVKGSVTTSAHEAGSTTWQTAVPNARIAGELPGYRNSQLPEVNAMAASLAVMEWRRRTGQYFSQSRSLLHKLRLEKPSIVALPASQEGQVR